MTTTPHLTANDEAELLARGAAIYHGRASIRVRREPTHRGSSMTERRFVMEGPSGRHSLWVDATDLERLNAHWSVFASDERNTF